MTEEIDWNKQQAGETRQGTVIILACYEDSQKEKRTYLSRQTSMFHFFKSSYLQGIAHRHLYSWTGDSVRDDTPTRQEEVPPPQIVVCRISHFL